jgi:hypothetical protein
MLDEIEICWTTAMAKARNAERAGGAKRQAATKVEAGRILVERNAKSGRLVAAHEAQVEAVMAAAQRSGLLQEKSGRIGGRVSPALVERAKARTGIEADTDLIEFALANIALEDKFAESFKAARGTVDPDLNLGF